MEPGTRVLGGGPRSPSGVPRPLDGHHGPPGLLGPRVPGAPGPLGPGSPEALGSPEAHGVP